MRLRSGWLVALLVAVAPSCSSPPSRPAAARPAYETVRLEGIPHVRQKPDFCGEACVEMVLRRLGADLTQDDVFARAEVDPALGRGAYTAELNRALVALGFQVGDVYATIDPRNAAAELERLFAALHADLRAGVPSIVCTRFDETPGASEHFRLVTGYDAATDEVIYHDPALASGAGLRMRRERLLSLWTLRYSPSRWTVIRLRLEPGEGGVAGPPAARPGFTPADFAQHVRALREDVPDGFTIRVEPPFVVLGDGTPEEVESSSEHTVRWAVRQLKSEYFAADPPFIIDVWLFRDEASYERHVRRLTGGEPSTPYGFYSEEKRALYMNIATGGGTLVHEIVHPFLDANFPARPAWISEGLASLYEQSGEEEGRIHGYTNWRLEGLQNALRAGRVRPFTELCALSETEFYGPGSGLHYAHARYVLYYLQQRGVLRRFYQELRASAASDPGGCATLLEVLGEPDHASFRKRWTEFTLALTFP